MGLVVETGDGLNPLANSYEDVSGFRSYWGDRELDNFDHTAFSDAKIGRALIKSTDYVERKYRNRFKGMRLVYDPPQPLSFPRSCLWVRCILIEGIPDQLKFAINEYAKRILTTTPDLDPDPAGFDATGQLIGIKKEKVGPIEIETTYEAGTASSMRSYPAADEWLQDFISGGSGVIRN